MELLFSLIRSTLIRTLICCSDRSVWQSRLCIADRLRLCQLGWKTTSSCFSALPWGWTNCTQESMALFVEHACAR